MSKLSKTSTALLQEDTEETETEGCSERGSDLEMLSICVHVNESEIHSRVLWDFLNLHSQ